MEHAMSDLLWEGVVNQYTNHMSTAAAPHLSHEETIRHFPPKHLHEISLLQLKLKLWVGTRGTLLRIIVVEGNKL